MSSPCVATLDPRRAPLPTHKTVMRIAKPAHIRLTARRHTARRVPRGVHHRNHLHRLKDEEERRRGLDNRGYISGRAARGVCTAPRWRWRRAAAVSASGATCSPASHSTCGGRVPGEPDDLHVGPDAAQLVRDREVLAHVPETDRTADVQHPWSAHVAPPLSSVVSGASYAVGVRPYGEESKRLDRPATKGAVTEEAIRTQCVPRTTTHFGCIERLRNAIWAEGQAGDFPSNQGLASVDSTQGPLA